MFVQQLDYTGIFSLIPEPGAVQCNQGPSLSEDLPHSQPYRHHRWIQEPGGVQPVPHKPGQHLNILLARTQ